MEDRLTESDCTLKKQNNLHCQCLLANPLAKEQPSGKDGCVCLEIWRDTSCQIPLTQSPGRIPQGLRPWWERMHALPPDLSGRFPNEALQHQQWYAHPTPQWCTRHKVDIRNSSARSQKTNLKYRCHTSTNQAKFTFRFCFIQWSSPPCHTLVHVYQIGIIGFRFAQIAFQEPSNLIVKIVGHELSAHEGKHFF